MKKDISRRNFIKHAVSGGFVSPLLLRDLGKVGNRGIKKSMGTASLSELSSAGADDERFWNLVRMQFPLTHDRYYFNTSGLGASPRIVLDTIYDEMMELETISETGHEKVKTVTAKIAAFFNAQPEEIAITRNTTEGMNIFARELPLEKGDEVLLCTHEHPGGSVPWLAVMKDKGIKINMFEPDFKTGEKNLEIIEKNLTKKTRVVSIDHIPCTTGTVFPAKEIVKLCRSRGIFIGFDGAHPPGQIPVDLKDIDPDFYALSGHKWLFGPKGTGVLFINKNIIQKLNPVFVGAYSDKVFKYEELILEYKMEANREEYGCRGTPIIMGLGKAFDFINALGIKNIHKRGSKMASYLKEELLKIPKVDILTPLNPAFSGAIVTFGIKEKKHNDIRDLLINDYKCRVRGIFEHGLNAVRISCAVYNSFEELDKLISAVKKIAKA
jgi:cysteine desulfurase/selenocysteine lyase